MLAWLGYLKMTCKYSFAKILLKNRYQVYRRYIHYNFFMQDEDSTADSTLTKSGNSAYIIVANDRKDQEVVVKIKEARK